MVLQCINGGGSNPVEGRTKLKKTIRRGDNVDKKNCIRRGDNVDKKNCIRRGDNVDKTKI
jgi:hypothetical protein